jgi:anhydro-N-acetylmuramic acid kinase
MRRLAAHGRRLLPHSRWQSSDGIGIPPMDMEAMAFAWLAWRHMNGCPGNHPGVTGALGERVLGSHTPA